jgi:hypothetical protein
LNFAACLQPLLEALRLQLVGLDNSRRNSRKAFRYPADGLGVSHHKRTQQQLLSIPEFTFAGNPFVSFRSSLRQIGASIFLPNAISSPTFVQLVFVSNF